MQERQEVRAEHLVWAGGAMLVAATAALRGWALAGGYFHRDDYALLVAARAAPLDLDQVVAPYDGRLVPAARLLAALVADTAGLDWTLAASITVAGQVLAGAAALWALVSLFGPRWTVLPLLAVHLASTLALPATLWWSASLTALPLQAALLTAVGAWVRHLRAPHPGWASLTGLALLAGLALDAQALLVLPVLGALALGHFATGGLRSRAGSVLGRHWRAAAVGSAVAGGYLAVCALWVGDGPGVGSGATRGDLTDLLARFGDAWGPALVGGPWTWAPGPGPTPVPDPPPWATVLAWVAVVVVVAHGVGRRQRTLRAWGLPVVHLAGVLALVATGLVPVAAGADHLVLAQAACVVTLGTGLAFLPLAGAAECSSPRTGTRWRLRVPATGVVTVAVLVYASGAASTVRYVGEWQARDAGEAYLTTLRDQLRTTGAVDLVDLPVPESVVPAALAPAHRVRALLSLVDDPARFPAATADLVAVGADGTLRQARMDENGAVRSRPGPLPGCGWLVRTPGRDVPLAALVPAGTVWARLGYLASADSPVAVAAGDLRVDTEVLAGLHSLWVRLDGPADRIRVSGLAAGVSMCVDVVELGQPAPGEPLP